MRTEGKKPLSSFYFACCHLHPQPEFSQSTRVKRIWLCMTSYEYKSTRQQLRFSSQRQYCDKNLMHRNALIAGPVTWSGSGFLSHDKDQYLLTSLITVRSTSSRTMTTNTVMQYWLNADSLEEVAFIERSAMVHAAPCVVLVVLPSMYKPGSA